MGNYTVDYASLPQLVIHPLNIDVSSLGDDNYRPVSVTRKVPLHAKFPALILASNAGLNESK